MRSGPAAAAHRRGPSAAFGRHVVRLESMRFSERRSPTGSRAYGTGAGRVRRETAAPPSAERRAPCGRAMRARAAPVRGNAPRARSPPRRHAFVCHSQSLPAPGEEGTSIRKGRDHGEDTKVDHARCRARGVGGRAGRRGSSRVRFERGTECPARSAHRRDNDQPERLGVARRRDPARAEGESAGTDGEGRRGRIGRGDRHGRQGRGRRTARALASRRGAVHGGRPRYVASAVRLQPLRHRRTGRRSGEGQTGQDGGGCLREHREQFFRVRLARRSSPARTRRSSRSGTRPASRPRATGT